MLQLTRSGAVLRGSRADLAHFNQQFQACDYIRIPQILDPSMLELIQSYLGRAEFYDRVHEGIGREICMVNNRLAGLLHFSVNNRVLFELLQGITGCGPIGCFSGRVYRMAADSGHYDSWHSDVGESRLLGMSINLGREVYSGGIFEMRHGESNQLLCRIANTGPGDATLFRISPGLRHRVTPVEGHVPKTAFAGWFQSQPDYRRILLPGN